MKDANDVILPLKVLFMIMQAFLIGCMFMTSVSIKEYQFSPAASTSDFTEKFQTFLNSCHGA